MKLLWSNHQKAPKSEDISNQKFSFTGIYDFVLQRRKGHELTASLLYRLLDFFFCQVFPANFYIPMPKFSSQKPFSCFKTPSFCSGFQQAHCRLYRNICSKTMETNRKPEHGNKSSLNYHLCFCSFFFKLQLEEICFHTFLNYLWINNSLICSKIRQHMLLKVEISDEEKQRSSVLSLF